MSEVILLWRYKLHRSLKQYQQVRAYLSYLWAWGHLKFNKPEVFSLVSAVCSNIKFAKNNTRTWAADLHNTVCFCVCDFGTETKVIVTEPSYLKPKPNRRFQFWFLKIEDMRFRFRFYNKTAPIWHPTVVSF